MKEQLYHTSQFKWEHSTMNFLEALQIFDELVNNPKSINNAPNVFYYHRYLTAGKYTIEDLYNKTHGESEEHLQPFNEDDLKNHMQFIQNYIQKKLTV